MISKKLKLGDTIGIISPSAPVTEKLKNQFERGIKFLENWGFKIKIASNALKNTQGY
jgi:muramoyltetrapeptide carboxypeptidase